MDAEFRSASRYLKTLQVRGRQVDEQLTTNPRSGSFICDCLDTFVQNGDGDCVCLDGYENQDGACVDIDECAADENPCSGENEVR